MNKVKPAQVIMLPIEDNSGTNIQLFGRTLEYHNILKFTNKDFYKYQHLYIISDDEIKEGDWYFDGTDFIHKKSKHNNTLVDGNKQAKKIIATTDTSLELPRLSQQFIQKYIEEYNRGNIITDVLVEYENKFDGKEYVDELDAYGYDKVKSILKINPQDNNITIKIAKDSCSREEVDRLLDEQASKTTAEMLEKFKGYRSKDEIRRLLFKFTNYFDLKRNIEITLDMQNKWVEENLS